MFIDPLYLFFILPGLFIGIIAQLLVWIFYSTYSRESAGSNLTGLQAASLINEREGFNVKIVTTNGHLNDYFNPLTNTVNLSADNATNASVANIAVAAHEFGHVEQKFKSSILFGIRSFMVPAVNVGSSIGYLFIILGIILSISGLAWLGILMFSLTTIFMLITVPVEIDASVRGMNLIKKYNLINTGRLGGARLVLFAASLTYIAALVQSLGQLLYFINLVQGRKN